VVEPSAPKLDQRPGPGAAGSPVTFFLAGAPDLEAVRRLDPDHDVHAFLRGEYTWVAQTYLRLRAAGYPVELSASLPASGTVVFHAKHKHELAQALGARGGLERLVLVGIRADNSPPLVADFEVLQNGRFAGGRRFVIPHWPQPGLVPRDASRGTRVERVGYFGLTENLDRPFRAEVWRRSLQGIGLEWVVQAVNFRMTGEATAAGGIDWEDYRTVDAVVAVRPRQRHGWNHKPANKLFNAWRAGVPALVGPEYAYRELRRGDEDYFEVTNPEEALAALRRLRDDPGLYSRVVSNGRRRAEEFSFAAIADRWAQVLWQEIPRQLALQPLLRRRALPLPLLLLLRRIRRRLGPRIH
jgi:hypothetical protein